MIDRTLLDAGGNVLLDLYRLTREQALFVKAEGLPDVLPTGTVEDVAGTGLRIYVGGEQFKAGTYTLSLGTHGMNHSEAFALQREVIRAAAVTRFIQRLDGGTLPIASFSKVSRSFSGSAQLGGQVDVTFEAASPYWLTQQREVAVPVGSLTPVLVQGQGRAALRLDLTAGESAVTTPSLLSDAGLTTWQGTVQPGQTLVIDGGVSGWQVTLGGVDVSLYLTGPQPYLEAGERAVTITAPGASALLSWHEGEL